MIDWKFSTKHIMILNWWLPDSPVKDRFGIILDGAVRSGKSLAWFCFLHQVGVRALPSPRRVSSSSQVRPSTRRCATSSDR